MDARFSDSVIVGGGPVRGCTGGHTGAARLRAEHRLDTAAPGAIIRDVLYWAIAIALAQLQLLVYALLG